jgi:perosamine synthetase
LIDALRSSWISSSGPYVDRFEKEFADFAVSGSAIAVSNGTVALHLALIRA